jgi:hypothetical protein
VQDSSEPFDGEDTDVGEDAERGIKGPHGWLNWLAASSGQPARTDSSTEGALLIPLWQEYGLYSDAWFVGELVLGPANVQLAFPGEQSRVGLAQMMLVLRVDTHLADPAFDTDAWKTEDVEVYHGGGVDDEFAVLLALALGRRLRSGGVIRQGLSKDDPAGCPFYGAHRVPQLAAPARGRSMLLGIAEEVALADAQELMDTYVRLSGHDAVAVVRAATQYADALWWADLDPRIAWIKLVGALEIAAKNVSDNEGLPPLAKFKRDMGLKYKSLKETFGEAVADAVAEEWDENAGATSRFVDFTVAHAPQPPAVRPPHGQVDWPDLRRALRLVYHWRSQDLHAGIPPGPMCQPAQHMGDDVAAERFPALAASQGGANWPAERMPMYLHTFAFIARQALTNWWRSLPDAGLLSDEGSA